MPVWMLSGPGLRMPVTVTFANDGIAPIYYRWPGQFYILDEDGNILKTYQPNMDVRKILPGKPYQMTIAMPLSGLKKGKYTFGFAILDPVSSKPAVRLAMDTSRSDVIQELGSFDIVSFWTFLSL